MAKIRYTSTEGGPLKFLDIHSIILPDGTRWDEVNGLNERPPEIRLLGPAVKEQIGKVLNMVAYHTNLTLAEITGKKRDGDIVLARHIAQYILLVDMKIPDAVVSKIFDRHRSTFRHVEEKVQDLLNMGDLEYTFFYDLIRSSLRWRTDASSQDLRPA